MEYLDTYTVNGSVSIPAPTNPIYGIYADKSIDISWDFNGKKGDLVKGVKVWEPHTPFNPALSSRIIINAAEQTQVTIRVAYDN